LPFYLRIREREIRRRGSSERHGRANKSGRIQRAGSHARSEFPDVPKTLADIVGERRCVYAELRPGASLDLEGLVSHLASRGVSKETWPERLVVVPELPRGSGGKVLKKQLRDEIAQRVAVEGRHFR
jgi:acyl-CoA synthetase (AMP-forming)/AMP-acid ligase II